MSTVLKGMFTPLQSDLYREQGDDRDAMVIARQSPADLAAFMAYTGGRDIAGGAGQAAGGMLGVDLRGPVQKHSGNVEAAKAAIAALDFDMNDPAQVDQFYRASIEILRKHALPSEALALSKEWQASKLAAKKEDRLERGQEAREKFQQDKMEAIKSGSWRGKMAAYTDILNALKADPSDTTLVNQRRALERQLGIQDDPAKGVKLVPSTRDQKGGVVKVNMDGSFVFVPIEEMNKERPVGDGGGGEGGGTEKERTRARKLAIEAKIRAGTATEEERAWLQTVYDEEGGKGKPPAEAELKGTAAVAQLKSLMPKFESTFSGGAYKFMPDALVRATAEAADRLGTNVSENNWWVQYETWYNGMLNALSGAAVTENEAVRFRQTRATRQMDPAVVPQRLATQVEIAEIGLKKLADARQAPRRVVPGAPARPGVATPAAPPAEGKRRKFNPATGKLE